MNYRLVIFDFDNTLANTPPKPRNQKEQRKMGWGGKDWWGSNASLPNGITFNSEVVEAFKKAKLDPNTRAVMMTGRRAISATRIREILEEQGLMGQWMTPGCERNKEFTHEEYYCGDFFSEPDYPTEWSKRQKKQVPINSTLVYKTYIIKKLMTPSVRHIAIWDDRQSHFKPFLALLAELRKQYSLKSTTFHKVFPPHSRGDVAKIKSFPAV